MSTENQENQENKEELETLEAEPVEAEEVSAKEDQNEEDVVIDGSQEIPKGEEFEYKAEMSKLLHLITHSLYSHKDIFLRELISNASDALNKINFASLTDSTILGEDTELKIDIKIDDEKKVFSIIDNGIGMNKEELIQNLGTIARSGTGKFIEQLTGDQKKDAELIGQFGVGFYSIFMVADEVVVETRSYESEQGYRWASTGLGAFNIAEIDRAERGTKISFQFKKDCEEYAAKWKIDNIVRKYSDFVSFPVSVNDEKANKTTAIWRRNKSEVEEEEYKEFYKYLTNKTEDPAATLHFNVEAPSQFNSILFIPSEADQQLLNAGHQETQISLYAKRVFIQDDCKELLPQWMRFVRGVVDSEDLPLNVSREVTQNSPVMEKINKYLVRKVLAELQSWADKDEEKYNKFWKSHGRILKEGLHLDFTNRDKLSELFRCASSHTPEELVSFKAYVERMQEGQEEIYYVYGKSREVIEQSPNLEYFRKNDIEVLYLYDEVDDFIIPGIGTYKEKTIVGIDKADLKLDKKDEDSKEGEESDKTKLNKDDQDKILQYIKDILGERVQDVIASSRLVESPCTLVSPKDGMNAHMESMMKMMNTGFANGKRVFEVNLDNELIKTLSKIQNQSPEDTLLKDCVEQLYENAALQEGSLDNPAQMIPRTIGIMNKAASLHLETVSPK